MIQLESSEPERIPEGEESKRLWVGNLDFRLTEYQLIKTLQRFGNIEKFDMLFHRRGPLEGQPRGYAFVTFSDQSEAVAAKNSLHGKKLGNKMISVKWAHAVTNDDCEKSQRIPKLPVLTGAKEEKKVENPSNTIQAIEAKLKMMESSSTSDLDFTGRPTLSIQPTSWKNPSQVKIPQGKTHRDRCRDKKKPYIKVKR